MAEVFSTAFIEAARDELVTLINALKTTMATGYDPTFSYVYEKHNVAKLQLNAVSVGLEGMDPTHVLANDYNIRYLMEFSVRVHTAYSDGISDGQKNERLLNSLINKFKKNIANLATGYRIEEVSGIEPNKSFDESASLGGEVSVFVSVTVEHVQE